MKKIIYITGNIDSPFFLNEIDYIKKEFDEVFVITYDGNMVKQNRIAQKNNIRYKKISCFLDFYKGAVGFILWLFSKQVRDEIKIVCDNGFNVKKLLYIFYYGLFSCIASSIIKKETKSFDGNVVLYSYWLSKGAYTIARNKKIPNVKYVVSRAHGYDLYEERNSLNYLPFREYINQKLDCIAFISQTGCDYFQHRWNSTGTTAHKRVIPLGVSKYNWIKQVAHSDKIVIASCSACIEIKRLDLIYKFVNCLNEMTTKKIVWIHIGDGPLLDQYCKMRFDSNVEIHFLGYIDNQKIRRVYSKNNVDYFINMSDSEGIPVSIMEAMSCGIPCIARNVGGNSEIITSDNGLIIDNKTINDEILKKYAILLLNSIENNEKYRKLSTEAYCKWNKEYNSKINYAKFIDIFKDVN